MEVLTIKEVLPLTTKLTGKEQEDNKLTYQIKEAILKEVNTRLGINAQSVLKILLNGLKKPEKQDANLVTYVRNATIWIIEHKRSQITKPIGKFVNINEYFYDMHQRGYEDTNGLNGKYYEYLLYHIAYENPFVKTEYLKELHKRCLYKANSLAEYLKLFEADLDKLNVPIPREALMEKSQKVVDYFNKLFQELEDMKDLWHLTD